MTTKFQIKDSYKKHIEQSFFSLIIIKNEYKTHMVKNNVNY